MWVDKNSYSSCRKESTILGDFFPSLFPLLALALSIKIFEASSSACHACSTFLRAVVAAASSSLLVDLAFLPLEVTRPPLSCTRLLVPLPPCLPWKLLLCCDGVRSCQG